VLLMNLAVPALERLSSEKPLERPS